MFSSNFESVSIYRFVGLAVGLNSSSSSLLFLIWKLKSETLNELPRSDIAFIAGMSQEL